jgi:NAD(P)-dependent dehydrogenase (short-subunit alcohol dehydrogenase family)
MTGIRAKASDVVEGAAERVQQNTSSSTLQNAAENVKKAAKAGDSAPMHGRTAIITGGNSGIGYESGLKIAQAGGHVILAVRSDDKGEDAVRSIQQEADAAGEGGKAEFMHIDLASLKSVKAFADEFKKRNQPLHVLMNNGGDFSPPDAITEEGFEYLTGVNYMAHWYLTQLLMDSLKAAAPEARVVFTTSPSESKTEDIDWDNLEGVGKSSTVAMYGATKLYAILAMRELQKRAQASGINGVEFFAAHPGIAKTGIFGRMEADWTKPLSTVLKLAGPIVGQSAEAGSRALVHAATSPDMKGKGGSVEHIVGPFYGPLKEISPAGTSGLITNTGNTEDRPARNPRAFDENNAVRLYDETKRILTHKVKDFDPDTKFL